MSAETTLVAAEAAIAVADAAVISAVQALRAALVDRGAAVKARDAARLMIPTHTAPTPPIERALLTESEAYIRSVGGYGEVARVLLDVAVPKRWQS